jgi:serine/threonine protein kinase
MAADWWSVGVMIYEMLSGLPTFRGADLRQTYQKVLYAEVIFKPEEKFSPPARELILGLLHRDPAKRLGAGPNSPKDIMEISFFNGINWQDIYNRVQDGPWVPPPDDFRRRQKGPQSFPLSRFTHPLILLLLLLLLLSVCLSLPALFPL